jgi:hypothetical protein
MSIEAMKLALDALEIYGAQAPAVNETITVLRQALANEALDRMAENARELGLDYDVKSDHRLMEQPAQQEPVACKHEWFRTGAMEVGQCRCIQCGIWNTSPPAQRTWVGLTDEEKADLFEGTAPYYNEADYADAIEAKLKEKNT